MRGTSDREEIEKLILTRLVRLNAMVSGVVTGLIAGFLLFLATIWLVLKGGEVVGPHLAQLGSLFWGYRVTLFGSLVGFFYGFISGFISGYSVAYLYNWFSQFRFKRRGK